MATNAEHNALHNDNLSNINGAGHNQAGSPGTTTHDFEKITRGMSHEEKHRAQQAARFGYGPLAHMRTNEDATLPGKLKLLYDAVTWSILAILKQ